MADVPVSAADLRRFGLFADQPDAELDALAADARRRRLVDREILALAGQPATAVDLVAVGRLGLSVEHEGRSVLVMTLGPGELLGWSVLREDPTALATARSVGPTEVIEIPAGRILDAVTGCTPTARTLVQRLFGAAAADLQATREQLLRLGREGVITAG